MKQENTSGETSMDMLELVLKDLLDEQQKTSRQLDAQATLIKEMSAILKTIPEKTVANKSAVAAAPNTKALEEMIRTGLSNIQHTIAESPTHITRKFELHLFPEIVAKVYLFLYGRCLLFIAVLFCVNSTYEWCIHYSDIQKEIKMQQLENERILKVRNQKIPQPTKANKKPKDTVLFRPPVRG